MWTKLTHSNVLTGTCPQSYFNGTSSPLFVPLAVTSSNSSNTYELLAWLSLSVTPYFFTTATFPNVTSTQGSEVLFDVTPYVANDSATIAATVAPTEAASWLVFHQANWSLVGTVPQSPEYNTVEVVFNATNSGQSSTATLNVLISDSTGSAQPSGTAPVPNKGTHGSHGLSKAGIICLAVILPLAFLALLALLLFCCCRRRRRSEKQEGEGLEKTVHTDDDSFYAGSPNPDPFRRSQGIDPQPALIARVKSLGLRNFRQSTDKRADTEAPTRMQGMRAIFSMGGEKKNVEVINTPELNSSGSFLGQGDVIGVDDPHRDTLNDGSSFTQSFESGSSRASWESPDSFQWSTSDHGAMETPPDTPVPATGFQEMPVRRQSSARSIPRPRANFIPRYPRHSSPTRLAQLASQHSLGMTEIGQPSDDTHTASRDASEPFTSRSMTTTGTGNGSYFQSRGFGDSTFASVEEESEISSDAIVSTATRVSAEDARPTVHGFVPRLGEVYEYRAVPEANEHDGGAQSRKVSAEAGVFSDAGHDDSDRQLRVSALSAYPDTERDVRSSTMSAIPLNDDKPFSPPLPSVGSFVRPVTRSFTPPGLLATPPTLSSPTTVSSTSTPRTLGPVFGTMSSSSGSKGGNDGRVLAATNETFSIHPHLNPPPSVSLSAATWSSSPPSTYRAEIDGGGALPSWLRFDARDLELWGVPKPQHAGQETVVRIVEKLPRSNRNGDPMSFGYEPPTEREVGRVLIEVVNRSGTPGVDATHAL